MTEKKEADIYYSDHPCGQYHRYFALEHIGDESSKTVLIPLVCTNCGTLVVHTLHL